MKAIIVDDEPKAIDLLKGYLAHFSSIELIASFRNGLKALEYCGKNRVDLVFLDINMPQLTGLSLSRMLPRETKVIFTTAHAEFAVDSYDVEAADYLLKPISLERFAKAIGKIMEQPKVQEKGARHLLIKSGARTHRISPEDILFLEKEGNYLVYHMESRKIVARSSVSEALEVLPPSFVQVHKSFIVNLERVDYVDREIIVILHTRIPLGPVYREAFLRVFRV
ncbi:MAG: response regulator transcription factor [Saprospiraceae bacterium]|nr:response regulator transcription factor [Lewinellaceae bacterium]